MNFFILGTILTWYVVDGYDLHPATFCDDSAVLHDIIDSASDGEKAFGVDVFKTICQRSEGNIAISPLATYMGGSKVYFGADEHTRRNIPKIANITCNCLDAQFGLQVISHNVEALNGPVVRIQNHMLHKPDLKLKYPFVRIIDSVYGHLPQPFDFAQKSAGSKLKNFIVRSHDGIVINDVSNYIDPTDSLVLIDTATYIQQWSQINRTYFDPPMTFHDISTSDVNYVHTMGTFIHGFTDASDTKVEYVVIPIKTQHVNHNVNMIIILPDENSLAYELNNINVNDDLLHEIMTMGKKVDIHVALPEFDIKFSGDITHSLRKIVGDGMFTNATNLFGITDTRKIHIDKVLHFARIRLQAECGTALCPPPGIQRLIANRPFIIVITTIGSHPLILMMGQYFGPQD